LYEKRNIPNKFVLKYIDWILYQEKQKALHKYHNLWKDPTTKYSKKELARARVTFKAFDGLIFTNDIFRKIYKDVRFVSVIRNGYAVCEGRMRRGHSLEKTAYEYNKVGNEIARNMSNPDYLCVKFEDMITVPLKTINKIYAHCALDITKCKYFRLKHKPTVTKTGESVLEGDSENRLHWYTPEEIDNHFNTDVDQNQIAKLSKSELIYLKKVIGPTMRKFNYPL
jgi:hypothetical protein